MNSKHKKLSLTVKILAYVISATLFVGYLLILTLAPKVCIEYKLYYIDDVMSDWPGYGGLAYTPGTVVELASSKRLGYGWQEDRENGIKSKSGSASLFFTVETKSDLKAELTVGEKLCTKYSIIVNGTELLTDVTEENTVLYFDIPSSLIGDNGLIELKVISENDVSKSDSGVQLFTVTFYEKEVLQ